MALSPIEGGRKGQSAGRGVNNLSASDAPASWRIVPGEQITLTGNRLSKRTVDTELYTAWKSGHFSFSGDLREIFGQIARWYDVTLEYRRDISQNLELDGRLSRHTPLENLLRYVSDASGAFEFEIVTKNGERRLIVK